jgi:hypothetical protein
MHLIFIPAFAINDCPVYYNEFCTGVGPLYTIQFIQVDGYSYSGRRCIGDVSLETVIEECIATCNRHKHPYVLIGHSTGSLLVDRMYTKLTTKPLSVILLNPIMRHPRLRLCRRIPLITPIMRLLDVLPIPLITHVYNGKQFGTGSDVTPPMKYRLWIDLRASITSERKLPSNSTTVIISTRDDIGNGGELLQCADMHTTNYPGHASFRSLQCMAHIISRLATLETPMFESLYNIS